MGCGTGLIKYLLLLFDAIFMIGGLTLVILGAIFHFKIELITSLHLKNTFVPSIFLISIGIFIFIIAFLGCCGVVKESSCMLMTFSVVVSLLFFTQLVAGILVIVYQSHVNVFVTEEMDKAIQNYSKNNKSFIDDLQTTLHCCGVNGSSDWQNITDGIPDSCKCKVSDTHCDKGIYNVGCLPTLIEKLRSSGVILGGVAIALAFVELVSIIFSCAYVSLTKNTDHPILDFTSYYN